MNDKEFFNSVAHKWDEMCNHNEDKIRQILNLSDIKQKSSILDVGTGTGVLIKFLLEYNPEKITAIDLSENMIEMAKKKYTDERIEFLCGDVLEHQGQYDYIFLYSVYPHFTDKEKLLKQLFSILKLGGKIVVAHSQSKEQINAIHRSHKAVEDHKLPPAEVTAKLFSKYFLVQTVIDNDEMYMVSGIKNRDRKNRDS
ncbi:hypothetical protein Q428_15010 [Fervidicella metallireducens AeB]|uniref:Methyltransferase type 11 domain-containing protein n=1 Tax=Fervidicella metallireducens AeB TaxID=1403537 RepID=A0A017RRD5_9CLOT|nr:class I SAM-dependent methyltransferase [Fervidicella metallireducens]EYE87141.1 hypothetical protein Q428_15010 [Fervidicella metallireducens AeB]